MIPTEPIHVASRSRSIFSHLAPAEGSETGEKNRLAREPASAGRPCPPENAPRSVVMEWAYEEYYRLRREGQAPDLRDFCAQFPAHRSMLLGMFDAAKYLDDNLAGLAEVTRATSADEGVSWPTEGERRGDWTIVRELGRGTFARVYLAAEASTGDRPVVLKFSLHDGAEARTLGRLAHPHIVPILSAHREQATGLSIVCMPYLGGVPLEQLLARAAPPHAPRPRRAAVLIDGLHAVARPEDPPAGPIDPRLHKGSFIDGVLHLAIQLADSLAFLHARGVCHCDLKPSNILIDPSGKPLLLDFNLSAHERESVPAGGTPAYMAPEQLRVFLKESREKVDGRADLFALAVILCEMLTGEHPYGPLPRMDGRSLARYLRERLPGGLPPLRRQYPQLARPVAAILERCLAYDPADRPASAAEVATELRRHFAPARRTRRWLAARPRLILTVLCLGMFAAAAAGYAGIVAPTSAERAFAAGKKAYQDHHYEEAEQSFDRALQDQATNSRWHHARGWARLHASGHLPDDRAREKMDQAWNDLMYGRAGQMDAGLLEVKAYLLARQQNSRPALGIYNQLAAGGHRKAALLNNRAFCLLQSASGSNRDSQYAQAEQDLNEALRLTPTCAAVYYNRATLALCRGSAAQESLDDIERALRLDPSPTLYRDAALLYAQAADLRRTPVMLDAPIAAAVFLEARPRRIERALFCARQAIAGGQSPRHFAIFKKLVPRSVLSELQQMQPGPTILSAEPRLIAPGGELD